MQRINVRSLETFDENKERRREQNRLAQRRHREKVKKEKELMRNNPNFNSNDSFTDSQNNNNHVNHINQFELNSSGSYYPFESNELLGQEEIRLDSEGNLAFGDGNSFSLVESSPLTFSQENEFGNESALQFDGLDVYASPGTSESNSSSSLVVSNYHSPSSSKTGSPASDPLLLFSDAKDEKWRQHMASIRWSFPDECNLVLPMHTMGRALVEIFNIYKKAMPNLSLSMDDLCEGDSISQLTNYEPDENFLQVMPANLHPTQLQRTVRHHPWVDFLPWPEVRDKLIRCQNVFDDDALCEDMNTDDSIVVRGCAPWMEMSWEVKETFAKKYWFLLTPQIIEYSNFWRLQRGEPPLKIGLEKFMTPHPQSPSQTTVSQ